MVSLKLQKRLAASVLGCGLRKVWLDPNEVNEISMANSSEFNLYWDTFWPCDIVAVAAWLEAASAVLQGRHSSDPAGVCYFERCFRPPINRAAGAKAAEEQQHWQQQHTRVATAYAAMQPA
jgi:hypothetical protein